MARPRQANIPTDLTDLIEAKVDFSPLTTFVNQVKDKLREYNIDDSSISVPDTSKMVVINQKPELLREVIVNQNNSIKRLERRND